MLFGTKKWEMYHLKFKKMDILHLQLKVLWSLFSKLWCVHTFSGLWKKSNLVFI